MSDTTDDPLIENPPDETEPDTTPSENPEGFPYAQICGLLGYDPTEIKALTITETQAIAVSVDYPEPLIREGAHDA